MKVPIRTYSRNGCWVKSCVAFATIGMSNGSVMYSQPGGLYQQNKKQGRAHTCWAVGFTLTQLPTCTPVAQRWAPTVGICTLFFIILNQKFIIKLADLLDILNLYRFFFLKFKSVY